MNLPGIITATDDLPPPLRTAAFREVWAEWERYRRVEKRNKLTPTTSLRQLKMLAAVGESRAIATLDLSMTNGWVGLFPEKTESGVNGNNREAIARVPVWRQIKAVEELISALDKQLRQIPNPAPSVFPKEAAAAEVKRKPLRERKSELNRQLYDLKARQAGGEG